MKGKPRNSGVFTFCQLNVVIKSTVDPLAREAYTEARSLHIGAFFVGIIRFLSIIWLQLTTIFVHAAAAMAAL